MKSAFPFFVVVVVLVGLSGCCGTGGFLSPHGHCLIDGSCGHCSDCPETCQSCDADGGCCGESCGVDEDCCECAEPYCQETCERECRLGDRIRARRYVNPGPPTGAVAYPYYTTRGPRDFLASDPRVIGP
ncbi:MAG: hypothetical protein JW888_03880 [Pirellulales bacterium]|nr:hypothetical protein [Pirellulales bacterium]